MEQVNVMALEKRYDVGFMDCEGTFYEVDNITVYELVYDSSLVATITEDNNGVNMVYTVRGYVRGNSCFCEDVFINPSEDELVDCVDSILDAIEWGNNNE